MLLMVLDGSWMSIAILGKLGRVKTANSKTVKVIIPCKKKLVFMICEKLESKLCNNL